MLKRLTMSRLTRKDERNFYKSLTKNEKVAIVKALKTNKPWDYNNKDIKTVKDKIKKFHLERTRNRCCYCNSSLIDRNIESDREHIIPKSINKNLSYYIFNLSVSCKRCNMAYKKDDISHIIEPKNIIRKLRESDNYNIPHPNIDNYEEHIGYFYLCVDKSELLIYRPFSAKGKRLYEMFSLQTLEINTLFRAQGAYMPLEIEEIQAFLFRGFF